MSKHQILEVPITLKINITKIEQDVAKAVNNGMSVATRRIHDWLSEEVSRTMEIQMRNALRNEIKKEIKKAL